MIEKHVCGECGSSIGDHYRCDTCGKDLIIEYLGIPITLSCGYGSPLDGTEYHFCDSICLLDFISAEQKKETK
jgi:hypothetical protein